MEELDRARPRLYISGPMRGHSELNILAFEDASRRARALGWEPVIPHGIQPVEHHGPCPEGYEYGMGGHSGWCHLLADIAVMVACDAVLLLEGWATSQGARHEFHVAQRFHVPNYFDDPRDGRKLPQVMREGSAL